MEELANVEINVLNEVILLLMWLGIYGSMAFAAIGSMAGCSIAGKAAAGAMLELESGYAKYSGVAAMPASQIIYGFVVMFTLMGLDRNVTSAAAIAVIGITVGLVLMYNAIKQGQVIAAGFKVAKSKPEVFVFASIIPAAVVEGFAVFAFIFALIVIGTI